MSGKNYLDRLVMGDRISANVPASGVAVSRIRVDMIDGDPEQPRRVFDEQKLEELAGSLRRHGQLQPIRVRKAGAPGRYIVVAGERRLRASRLAGMQTIDAIVIEERATLDTVREEQFVENVIRADLNPLETAEAYRRLLGLWGCSQAELARRLAVSPATVSRSLALLEAPEDTQAKIAAGESVRRATGGDRVPRKHKAATSDKRRALELELVSGSVRVKRGHTLEQLVEELRVVIADRAPRADAA